MRDLLRECYVIPDTPCRHDAFVRSTVLGIVPQNVSTVLNLPVFYYYYYCYFIHKKMNWVDW